LSFTLSTVVFCFLSLTISRVHLKFTHLARNGEDVIPQTDLKKIDFMGLCSIYTHTLLISVHYNIIGVVWLECKKKKYHFQYDWHWLMCPWVRWHPLNRIMKLERRWMLSSWTILVLVIVSYQNLHVGPCSVKCYFLCNKMMQRNNNVSIYF